MSSPQAELRSHLQAIADLLGQPRAVPDRSQLVAAVREARRLVRAAGHDDGLLALVLRNMISDLGKSNVPFDAAYFSKHLQQAIDRL